MSTLHPEAPVTPADDSGADAGGPRIPAVRNALAVLRRIGQSTRPVPASALARALGIPRSSTYQLLQVLIDEGLVVHVPETHGYALGVGVFELGSAYLRQGRLEHLARPLLVRLARTIGETAQLGVLHGSATLYLIKEQPARPTALVTDVGVRLPAHLTASGRSMLALLPEGELLAYYPHAAAFTQLAGGGPTSYRELRAVLGQDAARGWTLESGNVTEGISCIAAAARDRSGRPVASVVTSFLTRRRADTDDIAREVVRTADELSRRLGGAGS
jgi:DNA-binding IclR family transcriptional regulator